MSRKSTQARRAVGRSAGGAEKARARRRQGRPLPGPPLYEMRRQATARLRELSNALRDLRQEYLDAAEVCARLKAAQPSSASDLDPNEQGAVAGRTQPAVAESEPSTEAVGRVQAFEQRLRETAAELAEKQTAAAKLEEIRDALAGHLGKVEGELADEQSRAERLEVRVAELEDQVRQFQTLNRQSTESSEEWRERVATVQAELKRAQTTNVRLRDDMSGLLRFLDELGTILAPAAQPR